MRPLWLHVLRSGNVALYLQTPLRKFCVVWTKNFLIIPLKLVKMQVFGLREVRMAGQVPVMCIVNSTDHYILLKKGQEIGRAYPADVVDENAEINAVGVKTKTKPNSVCSSHCSSPHTSHQDVPSSHDDRPVIPYHLKQNLTSQQHDQLTDLLVSYEDVFAKNDFDMGSFTSIEHIIDTSDAKRVKHRMRRIPIRFAEEEETQLKKMLETGIIEESISDWADIQF